MKQWTKIVDEVPPTGYNIVIDTGYKYIMLRPGTKLDSSWSWLALPPFEKWFPIKDLPYLLYTIAVTTDGNDIEIADAVDVDRNDFKFWYPIC